MKARDWADPSTSLEMWRRAETQRCNAASCDCSGVDAGGRRDDGDHYVDI